MVAKKKEDVLTAEDRLKAALVPEDERPYHIPENWVWCKLENILNVKYGKGLKKEIREDGEYPVYGSNGIVGFHNQSLTIGPTIIIGRKGSVGKVHYSQTKCWPIDTTYYVDQLSLIEYSFLYYLLSNIKLEELDKSTAIPGINRNDLYSISIPLPPLFEQQRIAEKLESLLGKMKEAKALLDEIPEIIQNLRQSILAAACSGRLTEEWRQQNPNTVMRNLHNVEQEDVNADLAAAGYDLRDMPESWFVTSIKHLGRVKGGKRLPKGGKLVDYNTGYPYIKAGDLKNGTVTLNQLEYLTPEVQKRIKNYTVADGDIYVTIVGAYIGDAGIIPKELNGANLTENAAKICGLSNCNNKYLAFWLRSAIAQELIRNRISSAAQGKLALHRIETIAVPLPSIGEQEEIVRFVESLFSKADDLETQFKEALELVEPVPEIILSKAFRGELVPQDPNDEPASVLLARILAHFADISTHTKRPHQEPASPRKELNQQRGYTVPRKRRDSDVKGKPFLTDKLRDLGGKASAEQLYEASGLPIVDFYKQLSDEYNQAWLKKTGDLVEVT